MTLTATPQPGIVLALLIDSVGTFLWTNADQAAALKEGWYLDEQDGKICADDELDRFATPQEVIDHLTERSSSVGAHQMRSMTAMVFDNHSAMLAWANDIKTKFPEGDDA